MEFCRDRLCSCSMPRKVFAMNLAPDLQQPVRLWFAFCVIPV